MTEPGGASGPEERGAAFLRMLERLHERHLVGVEGVREIWLVRHGDAWSDIASLPDGRLDPPLTPLGRDQAERLARRVHGVRLDAVWASDLRRAVETAEPIANDRGLTIQTDPRLREVRTHWDEGREAALTEPNEYPFPESEADVYERVRTALEEIADGLPAAGRAVVVTHNAVIGVYVSNVLGLGWGRLPIMPTYTSVTVLAMKEARVVVRSLADATHLLEGLPD